MSREPARQPEVKRCATCGRLFTWRSRWRQHWSEIRYCGERCRRSRPRAVDRRLEESILTLLDARSRGASLCPSEAARAVRPDGWRALMDRTRWAAGRLVAAGEVEILQRGRPVEISDARGPIRLRRCARRGPNRA